MENIFLSDIMFLKILLLLFTLIILGIVFFYFKNPNITGTYTVKYKKPGWLFWLKIKNLKGDGILFGGPNNQTISSRYFILHDDSRIEMPINLMFKFDSSRCKMIDNQIRKETGH